MKNKTVAIVGATGAVGREFIGCIESRGIDIKALKLLASARSAGKTYPFRGKDLIVEELKDDSFMRCRRAPTRRHLCVSVS